MIDSGSNSSLDEILESLKLSNIKTLTNQATKKKISKLEIGAPVNFHVVENIGLGQASTMKTMIDSRLNCSLDEILESLKLNNIKPNKKPFQLADEFIKQNGGYEKFNETFKEKTGASASIQPSRPAPAIPTKTMHKSGSSSAVDTNFRFFIIRYKKFHN